MNELENCPFCGAPNPSIWKRDDGWCVKCVNGCAVEIGGYLSKAGAARAWNSRPRPEDAGDDPQVAYIAELEIENERLRLANEKTYCAYCGAEFIVDAPDSAEAVGEHIRTCEKHPMRQVEAERDELLAACNMVPRLLREIRGFASDLFGGESSLTDCIDLVLAETESAIAKTGG